MLKAYNEKIDRYETWNALFTGPTTGLFGNNVYESYMDYMYSWEHWSDRIFLSDYYEEQLYSVQSDTYVTVKSTQEGYDCIYELAQVKVKEQDVYKRQLLITAIGAHIIRMIQPLIVTEEECDKAVAIIEATIKYLEK